MSCYSLAPRLLVPPAPVTLRPPTLLVPPAFGDTEFGEAIQKSMESYGFKGVPLSYQEARIYHWNQETDRVIGIDNIPPELRVKQVMGEEWIYPNDPRIEYA